jgi:AcrR family transcriptional regulator
MLLAGGKRHMSEQRRPNVAPPDAPAPKRRLTREEARRLTRERLLDAAGLVFRKLGYHGASLEAVAEAAGYTKGAVYSNFATKADLFTALLDRFIEAETAIQDREISEASLESFVNSLDRVFDRQVARDAGWVVLQLEFWLAAVRDPALRQRLAEAGDDLRDKAAERLDAELRAAGVASPFDGRELGVLLNALATGFAIQYQIAPDRLDPSLLVRAARRLIGFDAGVAAETDAGNG